MAIARVKHEFLECKNSGNNCNCLECSGIMYCNVCGCMDDELLSSCPGYFLDGDSAKEIADRKVIDLDEYILKRYAKIMPLGFKSTGESE